MRHGALIGLTALLLAGCAVQEPPEDPGITGTLTLRLWDREARAKQLPPAMVTAQVVRQEGLDFTQLTMEPVTVRRPLRNGEIWLLSPKGRYQGQGGAAPDIAGADITLEPPLHLSGWLQGVPIAGTAASCAVDPGGHRIILEDVVLVRDGMRFTSPKMLIDEDRIQGMRQFVPGGAVVSTGLAALP